MKLQLRLIRIHKIFPSSVSLALLSNIVKCYGVSMVISCPPLSSWLHWVKVAYYSCTISLATAIFCLHYQFNCAGGQSSIYSISLTQIRRLFEMNSFKSSPLIQDPIKPRFNRKSKRVSRRRVSKEQDFVIPNPFRQGEQQNYLPMDLKRQIQQMDFISPSQVQTISFASAAGARRSSLFNRHLQSMQSAAKKQEEMYHFFMGGKPSNKQITQADPMESEQPMTIEQNDNLSTRMNHAFLIMDDAMEEEPLDFLSPDYEEEDVIFYSQKMIQSEDVENDYEAYFDV